MNQLFSNIIYNNNRNQINRRRLNNLNMNHIIYNTQNTYNNINRTNYSLNWRSNIQHTDNTRNISNEPILNIPLNTVI